MLSRLARVMISLSLLSTLIAMFIKAPIFTLVFLSLIIIPFVICEFPYRFIAWIALKTFYNKQSKYCCITLPFKNKYITVYNKIFGNGYEVSDRIKKHEEDHIKYFNEGIKILQVLKYVVYTIWYGYTNNPVEIRARKAENG